MEKGKMSEIFQNYPQASNQTRAHLWVHVCMDDYLCSRRRGTPWSQN